MPETSNRSGIIIIDKPAGITSAGVVSIVKKALRAKKVGHAGTLDPFAEGVLICCVNQATRLAEFLLHGRKTYIAELKLGEETDTQDSTGTVIASTAPQNFTKATIQAVVKEFEGTLEQLPPVYSALKHKGVPLYKLAHSGKPVQKPPRRIEIHYIRLLDLALPMIRFEVSCSAGTYIRTLGADIAKRLGCGGHLTALTRTACNGWNLDQALPLSDLERMVPGLGESPHFIDMADALPQMPAFTADAHVVKKIRHGQAITARELSGPGELDTAPKADLTIKVLDQMGKLVAILNYQEHDQPLKYCCVFAV